MPLCRLDKTKKGNKEKSRSGFKSRVSLSLCSGLEIQPDLLLLTSVTTPWSHHHSNRKIMLYVMMSRSSCLSLSTKSIESLLYLHMKCIFNKGFHTTSNYTSSCKGQSSFNALIIVYPLIPLLKVMQPLLKGFQ